MPNHTRMAEAINAAVADDFQQRGVQAPPQGVGETRRERMGSVIQQAIIEDFGTAGIPELGEEAGIGALQAAAPTFADAYRAGTDQFRSSLDLGQALVGDLIGNDEWVQEALSRAEVRDEITGGLMSGGTSFKDFVEDPDMGGALQFAKQTLGQLAPMAMESAVGALAGGMIGSIAAPGAGTVAGAASGVAGKALVRKALRDQLKLSLTGQGTKSADDVLSAALRLQAARRGAIAGGAATEIRVGSSEIYGESVEAGDPSPWLALAGSVPFAAIGILPDKLIIDGLASAVRGTDPASRSAIKSVLGGLAKQSAAEGVSEAGQEELLIQLHNVLSQDGYAGTEEAFWRRAEGFAAGAIGGGAVGSIAGATEAGINELNRGDIPGVEETPRVEALEGPEVSEQVIEATLGAYPIQEGENAQFVLTRDMLEDDSPLPESQGDIDAQFQAMMDDASAKQAVEITEGSPLPTDYSPDMEGIIRVETENGFLLTPDPDIAAMVQQGGGSGEVVAQALGYRAPKDVGMQRAVVAKDDAGNVVHSEMIAPDEDPESSLARARQFAPNVEFQNIDQTVEERAQKVRDEGRDPELEGALTRLNTTEKKINELQRSIDVLERARKMHEHQLRWGDIERRLPLLRLESAKLAAQHTEQERVATDLIARANQKTALDEVAEQHDRLVGELVMNARDETANRLDGVEVVDHHTGETITIPREEYERVAASMQEEGPDAGLTDVQVTERIAQEFEARGYILNQNDARPIRVAEDTRWNVQGRMVSEHELDSTNPLSFREAGQNRGGRVQVLARTYFLGPETQGVSVDGVVVPSSAVRKLRQMREKFPEDNWSIVQFENEKGDTVNAIQREQAFGPRRSDDPVVRDVDSTDSDAIELTRQRDDGLSVLPDPSSSTSAKERVYSAAEQARWKHNKQEAPSDFSLVMTDPDGRIGHYNARVIANAGMDANQYLVANNRLSEVERRRLGMYTALAILHEAGFRYDIASVESLRPVTRGRGRQAARHSIPAWTEVAGSWESMSLEQKQEVADLAGEDLTEAQLNDMSARDLPFEMQDVIRQQRDEIFLAQQEGRQPENVLDAGHRPETWTNRDTVGIKVLALVTEGVRIDPILNPILRTIFGQAKNEAGIIRDVYVLTDETSRDMIRSLPQAIQDQLMADPNMAPLFTKKPPRNLRGRTVHYDQGSVIWVNSNMKGDIQSMTLAHELGHVAFFEHIDNIANNPENAQQYRRMQASYKRAREGGLTKQYNDDRTGFEEWFADRFSAWVHSRERTVDGVARAGGFQKLYNALRGIAKRLRVSAMALAKAGSPAMLARLSRNKAVEQYFDGVASSHAKKRQLEKARRAAFDPSQVSAQRMEELEGEYRAEIERQMMEDPDVQLARARAELDASTQDLPMSQGMTHAVDENDPVANAQIERSSERAENGDMNRPNYHGDSGDVAHGMRREDPQPRIDFTDELEPQEGGGAGGQEPPGGQPPPEAPGGDGADGEIPFNRNQLYEAIMGNARRWGTTETFQDVLNWVNQNLGPVMQRGYKALRDLTWTDDARLRRLGANGRRLANWFYDDTFDRNTEGQRGYLNAVEMHLARWMAEAEQILPANRRDADAALMEAQSGKPTSELTRDGKKIRNFLRKFYTEQLSDIDGLHMRNDYFPRVYDMSMVIAHSDRFAAILESSGYTTAEAARIVEKMMESESNVELSTSDQEGSGPGMSARLHRQLENLDDTLLQNEGFVIEPRAALMQYMRSAVKRSEYEKRFSGEMSLSEVWGDLQRRRSEGKWVDDEFYNSMRERFENARDPDSVMIRDPSARIKQLINRMPEENRSEARQIVENYMGRSNTLFGAQLPPVLARSISAVGGAMYMATLGLSAISQITDFGAIIMRTRGAEGIGMMHRAIMQMPRDERLAFARAVGSISHQANLDALRMTYGNDFMTPTMRKMTDTFFKVIGLEQITNFSRSVATNMGAEFLKTHAIKARSELPGDAQRSQRYLEELRVTPEQIFEWENNGMRFDGEAGTAVREALFQFTDESILRPNAAMRPGWASNPWFTLMWQLKSFAWGFYKVVMRGVVNEVRQRRIEGTAITDQVAPIAMGAAIMLPLAFSTMVIRDIAKEGLNSAFDDDEYQWNSTRNRDATEWMLELTDRAGLLGPWAIVNSAYDSYGWGDNPVLTLAGPAAEKGGHLARGEFGRVSNDMIPVAGLVR